MANVSLDDVKEKFRTVQSINQDLKERKIRVESEISTLKKDYDEKVAEVLKRTGTSSLEEAMAFYNEKSKELESRVLELESELNKYLDTYSEEDET